MPTYQSRTHPRQMPISPPDYYPAYAANGCGGMQVAKQQYSGFAPAGMNYRHEKAYDCSQTYSQYSYAQPHVYRQQHQLSSTAYDNSAVAVVPHVQTYHNTAAPVLPPICVSEEMIAQRQYRAQDPRQERPKEEKPVGGVATHLDYEMDQMSDFVSEMAQGIVQPNSSVAPAFRKFVSQILSSTRLPRSTILLGLYYLSVRMQMISNQAQAPSKQGVGQVYRMLTVALLLSSKFMDDNTFQNRSWSEVTGLGVGELNSLETEWLAAIKWKLHVDFEDPCGYAAWSNHWDEWKIKATTHSIGALRLSPIDTTVQRQRSVHQNLSPVSTYSNYPKSAVLIHESNRQQQQYHTPAPTYEQSQRLYPGITERSPPSAPHTGPNTPEYYGYPGQWPYVAPPPAYSYGQARNSVHLPSQPPSYHQTPYIPQYPPNMWSMHATGCTCGYCMRSNDSYFVGQSYSGVQSVMG